MEENNVKLPYKNNIGAADVFLKMFGLFIAKTELIKVGVTLKILKDNVEVGNITFLEDNVVILAHTDLGYLNASFAIPLISGFRDLENLGSPRFAHWNTDISYTISKSETNLFKGLCVVECSIDDEFGSSAFCRNKLEYYENSEMKMQVKLEQDGLVFGAEFWEDDIHETISISPYHGINGYFNHVIRKGNYGDNGYSYEKYSGIFSAGSSIENENKFMAFTSTSENGKVYDTFHDYYEKDCSQENSYDINEQTAIKMAQIMKKIDPKMFEKIRELRNFLANSNCSLFDGLIDSSLNDYSNEEIQTFMGITKLRFNRNNNVRQLKI